MMRRVRQWMLPGAGLLVALLLHHAPLVAQTAVELRSQGLSYRRQGRFTEAIAALRQSVQLAPDHIPGRLVLGWTLHLNQQGREAADVLEQTILLDPYHAPTFNALGIIYLVNNDLASAVLTHEWAALVQPNNEIAHYNLSLAYERLQEYDWAIAQAQKAVALEPSNPHPLVAEAIAHWGAGDRTRAQQVYRNAMGLDGRYRTRSHLDRLKQAGFSPDQIEQTRQVWEASR